MANTKKKDSKLKKDSLIDNVSKKLKSTRKDVERQIEDVNDQIQELRKELTKPALKLIDSIERKYEVQLKKMESEYDQRLEALHKTQEKFLNMLPQEISQHLRFAQAKNTQASVKKAAATVKTELDKIKGIGPVLQKKLSDAGIKTLDALTNPSKAQADALEAFKSKRGFDSWKAQAEALLKGKKD
jgi:predicted flap endonuclease-1-like 5' DNA nuclease